MGPHFNAGCKQSCANSQFTILSIYPPFSQTKQWDNSCTLFMPSYATPVKAPRWSWPAPFLCKQECHSPVAFWSRSPGGATAAWSPPTLVSPTAPPSRPTTGLPDRVQERENCPSWWGHDRWLERELLVLELHPLLVRSHVDGSLGLLQLQQKFFL